MKKIKNSCNGSRGCKIVILPSDILKNNKKYEINFKKNRAKCSKR